MKRMKAIRGALYEVSSTRDDKTVHLLDEKNKSKQAKLYRFVASAKAPISALSIIEAIRPKMKPFDVRWHLSKLRSLGYLLAKTGVARPVAQRAEATATESIPTNGLTIEIPIPTMAREIASRAGDREVHLLMKRSAFWNALQEADPNKIIARLKEEGGLTEVLRTASGPKFLENIREGVRAGVSTLAAHA